MNKTFSGAALVSMIVSGSAIAADFADGANVTISGLSSRTSGYTLFLQGENANGDGIYLIESSAGPYLAGAAKEGGMVGWTSGADRGSASKWVLHHNSDGWSIMAADNEALAVSQSSNSSSGLELQRNQGRANQKYQIQSR